jgi:hypothetical protein
VCATEILDTITQEAECYVRFVALNSVPNALTARQIEDISAVDHELGLVRKAIAQGNIKEKPLEVRCVAWENWS